MAKIKRIFASEVINALGFPTLQGKLTLDNGLEVVSTIASSDPKNNFQNKEVRDQEASRFNGLGVKTSVYYINNLISPKLVGVSPLKQIDIDSWLIGADGTPDKSKLGVNTILVISQLLSKAGALELQLPLYKYLNKLYEKFDKRGIGIKKMPTPLFTMIIGGTTGQVDLEFKEFILIPSSSYTYSKSYLIGVNLYHLVRKLFRMVFSSNTDAIEALKQTIEAISLKLGRDIFIGINFEAASFYRQNQYTFKDKSEAVKEPEYINFITNLISKYFPLMIIDPIEYDNKQSWQKLNAMIGKDLYLVGEDMTSSNKQRIEDAVKGNILSTVILKLNQIGTISETFSLINYLRSNNIGYIISSGYGEINDDFISDLSVAVQSEFVKFGPPVHGENVTKYNRLLEIESEIIKL